MTEVVSLHFQLHTQGLTFKLEAKVVFMFPWASFMVSIQSSGPTGMNPEVQGISVSTPAPTPPHPNFPQPKAQRCRCSSSQTEVAVRWPLWKAQNQIKSHRDTGFLFLESREPDSHCLGVLFQSRQQHIQRVFPHPEVSERLLMLA